MILLAKTWLWLKANWKWLLFPLGALIWLIGFLSARRNVTAASPELLGAASTIRKADEEAKKELDEADTMRMHKIDEADKKRDDAVATVIENQEKDAKELQDDPDKLNSFLLNTGKAVRKP